MSTMWTDSVSIHWGFCACLAAQALIREPMHGYQIYPCYIVQSELYFWAEFHKLDIAATHRLIMGNMDTYGASFEERLTST